MALLRVPDPYDFELSTTRYRAFGPDLANLWHEGGLHRVIRDREVRITAASGGVEVEPFDPNIEAVVLQLLGAPFELDPFYAYARGDEILSALTTRLRGLRPPLAPTPFETLVTSLTAQQISLRAAFAIRNRLLERFGTRAQHAYAFPTPAQLAGVDPDDIAAIGFSRRKAACVVTLAQRADELDALAALEDGQVKTRLVELPCVGEWTADWFLGRHLARPRAWPAGDLALRKAASAFYGAGRQLSTVEVRELGERFEPFQNLTAHYLLAGQAP